MYGLKPVPFTESSFPSGAKALSIFPRDGVAEATPFQGLGAFRIQ
jgi:hypothetical protein